ncbi:MULTISPECIES: NAD-dependent epimerase/dehydratase family protein [Agrobacterium]|uniref:NAD-dependent epimerase/dehydratase family protein n=1 Tax=Agrobacterium tumefaciens TaxID=358 RepID=A0AAJ4N4V7_AGRTU|nr:MULTISPECIES: NAD-dependent epimerase/dehydratase family protein [Agrobacterium]MBO9111467.1 GDP-mannose 4,6-dehydratase [Agrobacterium sp. S2/73]NTA18592.1 NAD-dependent epimerase/dehydratase family protein [Agrobacterium tumefaciens]QTG14808.1 NAD-dependent epimerase/dehydratase family protein [Agrobacterium tumefaciens]QXZ75397.1 GDP-mannose 4,6-dehydratase [Agrobacterium sp. S7/73]WCK16160.1 GDP-mannose 4,6-dehydratase [Agrobacterium tumefaciens]
MRDCILVTGGAGFIGSALSGLICSENVPVVAIDSMVQQVHPTGQTSEFLDKRVVLHKNDVRDKGAWAALLEEFYPKKVIHLAAETGTAQSLTESTRHASVNVVGTTAMVDAFASNGVVPDRIILASSRAVYGEGLWRDLITKETYYPAPRSNAVLSRSQWTPHSPAGNESEALPHEASVVFPKPTSVYGATKLAQEQILSAWCGAFGVPLSILRLQNVYGEGQSPYNSYTGIINVFHRVARSGAPIPVYEDGLIGRDFVHIQDVACAFLSVLNDDTAENHLFDVGTGRLTTILEAANMIANYHNAPAPQICGKFRDGDVRSAVADTDKLRSLTGSAPQVSFEEGMKRVGDWLMASGHI